MDHVRRTPDARRPLSGDLFVGNVRAQPLHGNEHFRVQEVAFAPGGRTTWHTHSFHQVLVITDGSGVVATDDEERHVQPGDVLHIAPGTRHWHGADADSPMAHLSINGLGETNL
jgi:quercetin dioxygenase-like cupin family protein